MVKYGSVTPDFIIKFVEEKCPLRGHNQYWERMIPCFLSLKDGVYQTWFTTQCNMSKSSVSQVLSVMKKTGIIQRVKKGKENFIRPIGDLKDLLDKNMSANASVLYEKEQDLASGGIFSSVNAAIGNTYRGFDLNKQNLGINLSVSIINGKAMKVIGGDSMVNDENVIDIVRDQEMKKGEIAVPDSGIMSDRIHTTTAPKPEGIIYPMDQNATAIPLLLQTLARLYDLEKRINEINAANTKIQQERNAIIAGANEQEKAFQLLKKQLEETLGAQAQLAAEKDELFVKLGTLPQENSALINELNETKREKDSVSRSIGEKDKVLADFGKKTEGLIKENQDLNLMNNTSGAELLKSQAEIKMLREKTIDLETKLNKQGEIISEFSAVKDKLKSAEEQLAKAQNVKKELEEQVSLMQQEIDCLSKITDGKSDNPEDPVQRKPVDAKQQVLDLLANKADGMMKQAGMIEKLDYSRSFLSQIFISLKDEGKISISPDPDDKRGNILKLLKQNSDGINDPEDRTEKDTPTEEFLEPENEPFEFSEMQKNFLILFVKNPQGLSLDKIQKSTGFNKETIEDILSLFKEMGLIEIKKHNRKDFVVVNSKKIKEDFPKLIQEEALKEFKKKLDDAMTNTRQLLRRNNFILLSSLHGLSSIGKEYSEKLIEAIVFEFSQEYSITVSDQQDFTKCRIDFVPKKDGKKPESAVGLENKGNGDETRAKPLNSDLAAIAIGSEKRLEQSVVGLMMEDCSANAEIFANKLSERGITANPADVRRVIKNINNNNGGQAIGERQIGEEVIYSLVC